MSRNELPTIRVFFVYTLISSRVPQSHSCVAVNPRIIDRSTEIQRLSREYTLNNFQNLFHNISQDCSHLNRIWALLLRLLLFILLHWVTNQISNFLLGKDKENLKFLLARVFCLGSPNHGELTWLHHSIGSKQLNQDSTKHSIWTKVMASYNRYMIHVIIH